MYIIIYIYIYIVTRTYVCMYICSMYMHMYTYSHIDKSAQHACLRSSCNKEQHFPNVQNEKSHSLVDTHTHIKGPGDVFPWHSRLQNPIPISDGRGIGRMMISDCTHGLLSARPCRFSLLSCPSLESVFLGKRSTVVDVPNSWCLFACVVEFWVNRIFHYVNCC